MAPMMELAMASTTPIPTAAGASRRSNMGIQCWAIVKPRIAAMPTTSPMMPPTRPMTADSQATSAATCRA
jgi:hypothetical protein